MNNQLKKGDIPIVPMPYGKINKKLAYKIITVTQFGLAVLMAEN